MSTTTKSNTDTAINVIGAIFGVIHFTFQTAADLTAHAEGSIVESISKGAITREQSITNRKNKTELTQTNMLIKLNELKAKCQPKPEAELKTA